MTNLIEVFKEDFLKTSDEEKREKKSFWASECETPLFDLYHKWIGTEPTNPLDLNGIMIMNTGKMLELSLVEILEKKGIAKIIDEQTRVEFELEEYGIKVSGYVDAILQNDIPLEIKTFYGDYQERDLQMGKARSSYMKQLAIYMYYLKASKGILLYINRGNGNMYQFDLLRQGTKFRLVKKRDEYGRIIDAEDVFDLADTFKRWADLYKNHIVPKIEPKSEFRYKIPVNEIDWNTISKTDISKARNNQKVIGDSWQVAYSAYKDLIIEREGSTLGYSDEELAIIKEKTKGYTSKK